MAQHFTTFLLRLPTACPQVNLSLSFFWQSPGRHLPGAAGPRILSSHSKPECGVLGWSSHFLFGQENGDPTVMQGAKDRASTPRGTVVTGVGKLPAQVSEEGQYPLTLSWGPGGGTGPEDAGEKPAAWWG